MSTRSSVSVRPKTVFPLLAAALLAATFAAAPVARGAEVPYLTGRVVDEARILSPAARERIEASLAAHEKATTNQVAVLTVPSLGSDSVEEFAVKVFSTWKLGQKGKDNGVLLVVAPEERRMRIEVGYGLEGVLTDGIAGSILRASLAPRFKTGDYDRGIEDGVGAILAVLESRGYEEAVAPAGASTKTAGNTGTNLGSFNAPDLPWYERVLLGAFIFGIIGLFTVLGVLTPGAGWFLYFFLIPFWAMFPIVVVGGKGAFVMLMTYLVAFPVAKLSIRKKIWYLKAAREIKSKGSTTVGGMVISSGGGSSSSSGGGGGFSGGGGSSGGGGASGSW